MAKLLTFRNDRKALFFSGLLIDRRCFGGCQEGALMANSLTFGNDRKAFFVSELLVE